MSLADGAFVSRSFRRSWAVIPLALLFTTCGGQNPAAPPSPTPAPTPTPVPATLDDLSATVTSSDAGHDLNCRTDVHARVTLTNHAASGVLVTGVLKTSRSVSGGCTAVPDFTYTITPRLVAGNSMSVVMDRTLYSNGSGCCDDPNNCGGSCDIEETFQVVTGIGNVPAGHFQYGIIFANCGACTMAGASSSQACRPISR